MHAARRFLSDIAAFFMPHDGLRLGFPFLTAFARLTRLAFTLVLIALDRAMAGRQVAVTVAHIVGLHTIFLPI